jgi:hypothetical protein
MVTSSLKAGAIIDTAGVSGDPCKKYLMVSSSGIFTLRCFWALWLIITKYM